MGSEGYDVRCRQVIKTADRRTVEFIEIRVIQACGIDRIAWPPSFSVSPRANAFTAAVPTGHVESMPMLTGNR
jgi:hypothetical protein